MIALSLSIPELVGAGTIHASPSEIWPSIIAADQTRLYWAIKRADYATQFCRSPYWYAVSSAVKQRASYRCQLCNSGYQLHVHHRTYENHGREHEAMADLICLCENCHAGAHGKPKAKPAFKPIAIKSAKRANNPAVIQGQASYILHVAKKRKVQSVPEKKAALKALVAKITSGAISFDQMKKRAATATLWYHLVE